MSDAVTQEAAPSSGEVYRRVVSRRRRNTVVSVLVRVVLTLGVGGVMIASAIRNAERQSVPGIADNLPQVMRVAEWRAAVGALFDAGAESRVLEPGELLTSAGEGVASSGVRLTITQFGEDPCVHTTEKVAGVYVGLDTTMVEPATGASPAEVCPGTAGAVGSGQG